MFYVPAPLSGPHINAITEEKGSILISWDEIPAQEQMGCILHYRIYWRERDSDSQPRFCGMCEKRTQGLLVQVSENTSVCVHTHAVLALCLPLSRCSINICEIE